jgi:SAM-dependent methyltransferase
MMLFRRLSGNGGRRGKAREWERLAARPRPSWYLDPLVAEQKRRLHLELVQRWADGRVARVLKTDLFEEAYGDDHLLLDLCPGACATIGIDQTPATVRQARAHWSVAGAHFLVSDVRGLALRSGSLDLVVSNSTLDHFDSADDFHAALAELARVLRPGGRLVVTMDNPQNPLYHLLRWASRLGWTPYPLGYTTSLGALAPSLEAAGLEVQEVASMIHNPRGVSTLLFLGLRWLLGPLADRPIRVALRLFSGLERLPTRRFTACFVAACGRKRGAAEEARTILPTQLQVGDH